MCSKEVSLILRDEGSIVFNLQGQMVGDYSIFGRDDNALHWDLVNEKQFTKIGTLVSEQSAWIS